MLKLTEPESLAELEESLRLYPDELFAAQVEYPADYLAKWDAETPARRPHRGSPRTIAITTTSCCS